MAATLTLWSGVFAALPTARLLLKARALEDPGVRARYRGLAAAAGIDPGRIDIVGVVNGDAAHLSALAKADIALDPVPFGGGRTTNETLSMGVPVVNLRSEMIMGRLGDSMLSRAGLGHLVASSAASFVETAVSLAQDLDRLESLRMGLRSSFLRSTLCDVTGYTRELEEAYAAMAAGAI
jgi:predicted O-linked N-acetylglucosamine transferase (SPINDLY family)